MNLKHFIDRPVLATVISVAIMLGGIIGLVSLPVEQYPLSLIHISEPTRL